MNIIFFIVAPNYGDKISKMHLLIFIKIFDDKNLIIIFKFKEIKFYLSILKFNFKINT